MLYFVAGVYMVAVATIFRPKNTLTLVAFNMPFFAIGVGIIVINYRTIAGIA